MGRPTTRPRPVLTEGGVFWSDNGARVCLRCAGMSARYTGHDISGQAVERVTTEDVRDWPAEFGPLTCETGCTTLAPIAGPDGWPLAKGGIR